MLERIRVRNLAVIDLAEVDLESGLTVLTGETGAGKSILIDALGLVLGDRADSGLLRAQAERAEVSAEFRIEEGSAAEGWLSGRNLNDGDACLVRRLIGRDGRSRAYVNGQPVNLRDLRELGALLVDVHGQHAHQSLGSKTVQTHLLDQHGGHQPLANTVADAFRDWQRAQSALDDAETAAREASAQQDLLRFQLNELQALELAPGEPEALDAEHRRLANADQLADQAHQLVHALLESENGSATSIVQKSVDQVAALGAMAEELKPVQDQLAEASVLLDDAAIALRSFRDSLEADPARLGFVEERLGQVRNLARKHGVQETELPELAERLSAKLDRIESSSEELAALTNTCAALRQKYLEAGKALTVKRRQAAPTFSQAVTDIIRQLGMPKARFRAQVEALDEGSGRALGLDDVSFLTQFNPGQPEQPMGKVASGGELSRLGLAIEVVAMSGRIPTLVFDEVDAGVGGGIAETVGRQLSELARDRQVLCVTHLPQVASLGDHHLHVVKLTDGKTTRTRVNALSSEERVEELSRMLGGLEITDQTRAHAKEMMQAAGSVRTDRAAGGG